MKNLLHRAEQALVALALNRKYRPLEERAAVALAKNVALRWGLSSAALAVALEVIDRVLS